MYKRQEALNALTVLESSESDALNSEIWTEGYFILLNILEPIIPHIAWELSEELFGRENFAPIAIDKKALESSQITLAITINGKKRAEISASAGASEEEILHLAKQSAQKWLENKEIKKQILVPNKLVNFVVI